MTKPRAITPKIFPVACENIYIARFLIYEANILAFMYIIKCQGKPDQVKSVSFQPAYVVSVSLGFRSKERLRNDEEKDFRFCPPSSLTRPCLRCFVIVFQRPYRYFSIALKVILSLSDLYKIFTKD